MKIKSIIILGITLLFMSSCASSNGLHKSSCKKKKGGSIKTSMGFMNRR